MASSSKASQRFEGTPGRPRLAEAPAAPAATPAEPELSDLLGRLERQAAESGRLNGRVTALENALRTERDARKRLVERLRQERRVSRSLSARAERAEAERAAALRDVERLRQAAASSEQQLQLTWTRLVEVEQALAWKSRSMFRKLFRRSPAD